MNILRAFIMTIAVAFMSITPLRADAALDGFKNDMASLAAYVAKQEASTDPMAGIATVRGIIGRLQALKTDGLPADLKQGFTEFVVAISKMGALLEDWPEKSEELRAFIANKIGEDPAYLGKLGEKMAAIDKDMEPAVKRLDALGAKYGIDMTKISSPK
jgi:hypothetical protein